MHTPRSETLIEAIYRDLINDDYLKEIHNNLLYNYSIKLFNNNTIQKDIKIMDALRFADLLSKSSLDDIKEIQNLWGQELIILLNLLYPDSLEVQYSLGNILSTLGNYRALKNNKKIEFLSNDLLDNIYYEYDKIQHIIPGKENQYFFHDQKDIFDNLDTKYFSYSGPTSMGKTFVVQTYIENQIKDGVKKNYAIIVPTKALINEIKNTFINSLREELRIKNYRVITSAGDLLLQQKHNLIMVMTPERLLYTLLDNADIKIDFLFVDEAQKAIEKNERNTYYIKLVSYVARRFPDAKIILSSPNIPNPEIFLSMVPNIKLNDIHKISSKYSPVCQFKFYIDFDTNKSSKISVYNDYTKEFIEIENNSDRFNNLLDVINKIGKNGQNLVYCSSRQKVLDYAIAYARELPVLNNDDLINLSNDIKNEVHKNCYLADLVLKGVAYHVGYLPASIRLRLERSFESGLIKTIFCTSTLVEGINLPADNLFVTSYRNGKKNMDEVEFRNLIGRVGRIKYNLYGNVFIIRDEKSLKSDKYIDLIKNNVPDQTLRINNNIIKKNYENIVHDLQEGNLELDQCIIDNQHDYNTLRNLSMILIRDLALGANTPVVESFISSGSLNEDMVDKLKIKYPLNKTSDDLTLSYDQLSNLRSAIEEGLSYPEATNPDNINYDEVVEFMIKLRNIFKWEKYEYKTVGRKGKTEAGPLKWYSLLLLRWIQGNGLNRIIDYSLKNKKDNPETGVWNGNTKIVDHYDHNSKLHQNYAMAQTLNDIDNVLLYTISNYFRKFSFEYKKYHNKDSLKNDWFEFVEYGSTSSIVRLLQKYGFSRQVSLYIKDHKNKFLKISDDEIKIYKNIFTCGYADAEEESQEIQFNIPELFIE